MNRPIVRLFGLFVVLYATLIGFTSYWSVFDAKGLRQNVANHRPLLEQQRIPRGDIRATDGALLARSRPVGHGPERIYVRNYPEGELFGNPVGYSYTDLTQAGLERYYNDDLVGNRPEFLSILDQLRGRAQQGDELVTTLDPTAQRTAEQALGGQCGSVVAIEPSTGRIRAMVSVPGYDPNTVNDPGQYAALNRNKEAPLFNRATQAAYQPGSTFKVVTAAAALDSGKYTPDSLINGDSPVTISGTPLSNDFNQSFGNITLTDALTHSVNTVFAQLGEQLGTSTIYKYMDRFGFNAKPQLDYPSDQMRTSGAFENGRLLGPGDSVDIGRIAIGQERLQVAPLQMAEVAAAVGNGGALMRPRLVERVVDQDGRNVKENKPEKQSQVISSEAASALAGMMSNVVREGTGTAAALSGVDVAGKTGTAEAGHSQCGSAPNTAWFIGFAPVDNPKVAVAAVVEQTSEFGGTAAAPIARQVMESLLR